MGRFTVLDPAKDRRGDGDLYDYCMDDPVSKKDPSGLLFWPVVRQVAKDVIFPESVNEAEVRIDISREKSKIDARIQDKTATSGDIKRYEELRKKDAQLKEKFEEEFSRHKDFWDRYPTF